MSNGYDTSRTDFGAVNRDMDSQIKVILREDEDNLIVELWDITFRPVYEERKALEFDLRTAVNLGNMLVIADEFHRPKSKNSVEK